MFFIWKRGIYLISIILFSLTRRKNKEHFTQSKVFRPNLLLLQLQHCSLLRKVREKTLVSEVTGEKRSISRYLVQMRENTDQKNPEYRHFSRYVSLPTNVKKQKEESEKSFRPLWERKKLKNSAMWNFRNIAIKKTILKISEHPLPI